MLRGQRRFMGPRLRILMLRDRYHVQEECRAAWVACGHEIVDVWLGSSPTPQAMLQAVLNALVAWRPDFVMSINFFGFDRQNWMAQVLAAAGVPCAVWCVDSPLLTLRGWLPMVHPEMHLFVWDRSYVPYLRALGAKHVHHLPLAASKRRYAPVRAHASHPQPACFVGGSLQRSAQVWGQSLSPTERTEANSWAKQLAHDPSALHTLNPTPQAPPCPQTLMLGMAQAQVSAHKRRAALAAIAPGDLYLWGDEGWREALPDVQLRGRVAYGDALDAVSAASAITLNITSAQMPSGVNQRVFDVPQSGSFLLSDRQDELGELFDDGREMVTFSSPQELQQRYTYFVARPSERAAIVERAQRRINAEHLYEHRVASIERTLRRAYTRPTRALARGGEQKSNQGLPS